MQKGSSAVQSYEQALIRFHLYRIKLIRPVQLSLLGDTLSSSELLAEAIRSRPELEVADDVKWHLGNIRTLGDANSIYFAVGRTTKSTVEKFDETAGDFVDEPLDASPYTHCVVLEDLGVAAIAHKHRLARTTEGVARRLQALLESTDPILRNNVRVEVLMIPNPHDFIDILQKAYAVLKFSATFRGPNPIDADELFQRPLAAIASATDAKEGQVVLQGDDLNRDAVTSITRSTAATGNKASARVKDKRNSSARSVRMDKTAVEVSFQEQDADPTKVAKEVRKRYKELRRNE